MPLSLSPFLTDCRVLQETWLCVKWIRSWSSRCRHILKHSHSLTYSYSRNNSSTFTRMYNPHTLCRVCVRTHVTVTHYHQNRIRLFYAPYKSCCLHTVCVCVRSTSERESITSAYPTRKCIVRILGRGQTTPVMVTLLWTLFMITSESQVWCQVPRMKDRMN